MDPVQNLYGLATALPQPYTLTLAATLSANRTVTYPDAAITVSGSASALTATRVPYATTGGLLTDAAALTFTVATGLLTATRFESTVATGTAPFTVASTTAVANLNASLLLGQNWGNPGAIGGTTPAAITCTTLTATGAFTSTVNADTSHLCQVINQSAGTSALAALELQNNSGSGCRFRFSDYSSGLTATAFGITLGGYVSTVALGASCNGLIIGCQSIDKPIIFGINTAEVGRWTSAGLTIAGSTPGTTSAGQVLIGGGDIKAAGSIQLLGGTVTLGADNSISRVGANALSYNQSATVNGAYIAFHDLTNGLDRGYVGYGATLFSGAAITDFGFRSNGALKIATNGGYLALTIDTSQNADLAGNMNIGSGKAYKVNGTQVIGAQIAAIADAAAVSGTATSGGYGCTDATEFNALMSAINAIKDKVNAAFGALRTHGLIAT